MIRFCCYLHTIENISSSFLSIILCQTESILCLSVRRHVYQGAFKQLCIVGEFCHSVHHLLQ